MPSAANVKVDKQISPENSVSEASGSCTPIRQVITLVEHKIRNLEKRKSKLESYRDLQNAGKELNSDQKTAVAKYNEVLHTLDFARDLYKQFLGIAVVSEKDAKKQAKKELAAKNQAELARLREILLVQDALNQMGNEVVREDFLHGKNGAAQLTENDLKLLDDLYPAVTPKHEAGKPTAFGNEVQAAAEHLLAVVDGKPKEVFGGSYSQVKEILGKIHESGYFDQVPAEENFVESEPVEVVPEVPLVPLETPQYAEILPVVPPLVEQAVPEQTAPPEPMYYQQPQPPRPITEMLGTGSFFFLQESEIDSPGEQQQIPTQTFTNQNFVVAPPQTIALTPMYANMGPVQLNGIEIEEAPKEDLKPNEAGGGNRRNNAYYQNNNGYSNRGRHPTNRSGARPARQN